MYRKNGQQRYHQRSTVTVSCEWELLQRVKDIAAEERYTLSEIVNTSFVDFIKKHKSNI